MPLTGRRSAFNGNKKVVDFPLPDGDIEAQLGLLSRAYKASLNQELAARKEIKGAYRGRYVNHAQKGIGLASLKAAKQAQLERDLAAFEAVRR